MRFKSLLFLLLLALVAGGVQKLPCIQMGFEHDCCAVESEMGVSNPSEKCCGADINKGFPVLGNSLSALIDSHPILVVAVADFFSQKEQNAFSVEPFLNEHWGGATHLPSYLEHATLLL